MKMFSTCSMAVMMQISSEQPIWPDASSMRACIGGTGNSAIRRPVQKKKKLRRNDVSSISALAPQRTQRLGQVSSRINGLQRVQPLQSVDHGLGWRGRHKGKAQHIVNAQGLQLVVSGE